MAMVNKRLGDMLLEEGRIDGEALVHALKVQKETHKVLGQILVELGYVTERDIVEILEVQYGIPQVQLNRVDIDPEIPKLINVKMARRYTLLPIRLENEKLSVAMADPLNLFAIEDLELATGLQIEPYLASESEVLIAIEQYYKKSSAEATVDAFSNSFQAQGGQDEIDMDSLLSVNNAPVVKLIDSVIYQAAESNVSDVHIEPREHDIRIRYRIDGDLQEHMTLKKSSLSAIITRIKIMGYMDIAENRVPQDGRVEYEIDNRRIDLRISVMPTVFGEKVVMRLLDRNNKVLTIEELGMTQKHIALYQKIIGVPNGIILVTGPTGSGKSTSLYATLMALNNVKKNIITVEDPVEYRLSGINQTQVNAKAGMTFATSLRSILRQDPDIIMIGEIRDGETAQIAVRAAITGHVVLSTLHTNDTASTVARLEDMGVEPFLVSSSLTGIVAQRLVKKICSNCKVSYEIDDHEAAALGTGRIKLHKGTGCNLCNHTGYRGRTAIYEILPVTKKIRELIDLRKGTEAIKEQATEEGMVTLYQSCLDLVLDGTTTTEELFRLTNHID